MRSQKLFGVPLFLVPLAAALALLSALFAPAQPPPPPPAFLAEYLTPDQNASTITLNGAGTDYVITIKGGVGVYNNETLSCAVYDFNTSSWQTQSPGGVPVLAGVPTLYTFTYTVPKNSAWGTAIGNGTYNAAYVAMTVTSAANPPTLYVEDWVYGL